MQIKSDQKSSEISNFYRNRNVFITGATGFLGKVLVEKLLRSCRAIGKIYLLLRAKKNKEPQQRFEELLNSKIFERVKNEFPESMIKLVPIYGDIALPELGLSSSDINLLVKEISIVFHCAASIRFNDPLKLAVGMNVLGTKGIIELCRQMYQLEALIHISTVYCNCDRDTIDEIIYPPPIEPQNLIDITTWMDDHLIEVITPHLLKERPNTYTYTKAVAEYLLLKESGNLPLAIVRPSIITSSWKEPYPGWVDNHNAMTGAFATVGKGLVQTMLLDVSKKGDLIPVDVVTNMTISAAWYIATNRSNKVVVYNCSSGKMNKQTWGNIVNNVNLAVKRVPFLQTYQYPNLQSVSSKLQYLLLKILKIFLPAYFTDFVATLSGQKPKLVALCKSVCRNVESLHYFTCHEWTFDNSNVNALYQKMSTTDKIEFSFDVSSLQWPDYVEKYFLGIRTFLFKEDPSSLPEARKVLKRQYMVKIAVKFFAMTLIGGFLCLIMI